MKIRACLKSIGDLHENAQLIQFTTTIPGRILVWMIATPLIWPSNRIVWLAPLLAIFLMRPGWRRELLCIGSLLFLYHGLAGRPSWQSAPIHLIVMLGTLVIVFTAYRTAKAFGSLPKFAQRHPLVCLHALLWPLMIVAWITPPTLAEPWQHLVEPFRWILPFLTWRLNYLLLAGKRGTLKGSGFLDHLWYCIPCFGGTNTPYGKGFDYLNSNRADGPVDIARIQLSGIKLLVLAKLWLLLQVELTAGFYGGQGGILGKVLDGNSLGFTRLGQLIGSSDVSLIAKWASLFGELIYFTLGMAAYGHLIIGCLRLFGFAVFRNTYKPLLAESIVEFWNRFYYYFKELLVEFFFFPVFAAYFKKKPKLRMFMAVMAAAFAGNIYYHFMRDFGTLENAGTTAAAAFMLPRILYSFLLGIGIFISMQRQQRLRGLRSETGKQKGMFRLRNIAVVWLFFSLIHIWNVDPINLSFDLRTRFFFSLFGIS